MAVLTGGVEVGHRSTAGSGEIVNGAIGNGAIGNAPLAGGKCEGAAFAGAEFPGGAFAKAAFPGDPPKARVFGSGAMDSGPLGAWPGMAACGAGRYGGKAGGSDVG